LRLTYRGAEQVLDVADGLRRVLRLPCAPDHTTLWWFARHRLSPERSRSALEATIRRVAPQGSSIPPVALDSTGLWLAHCSQYFAWRTKRDRSQRAWLKWAMALWVDPQLVLAQRVGPGPCGDFSDLVPLASAAYAVLPFRQLVAAAGYDSEGNHRFCRETLQVQSLIMAKPRRSLAIVATTPYRLEMCRLLGDPGEPAARQAYRRRWKAETVMSVTKRKFGGALTAPTPPMQDRQALLRGLVYNVHRLALLGCA
jgi:hypothetical protein